MRGMEESLRAQIPTLTPAERRVAAYFLENMEHLQDTPIGTVARESGVAKSAVVRLCKRLGLSGYKDFMQALRVERSGGMPWVARLPLSAEEAGSVEALCARVMEGTLRALRETQAGISPDAMRRAARALRDAQIIEVYGKGAVHPAAEACAQGLRRLGLRAYAVCDAPETLQTEEAVETAMLLLCQPAEAWNYAAQAEAACEVGAVVVAVAEAGDGIARTFADHALPYAARADERAAPLPLLALIDMLLACVAGL